MGINKRAEQHIDDRYKSKGTPAALTIVSLVVPSQKANRLTFKTQTWLTLISVWGFAFLLVLPSCIAFLTHCESLPFKSKIMPAVMSAMDRTVAVNILAAADRAQPSCCWDRAAAANTHTHTHANTHARTQTHARTRAIATACPGSPALYRHLLAGQENACGRAQESQQTGCILSATGCFNLSVKDHFQDH